jgi:3-oxoacyl-[acyl-carrier protein] reductase
MKSSQLRLQGKTALITGAGGGSAGVGRGIALALAAEGANVVIAARRKVSGDETASLIAREQGTALVVECDVSVRDNVEAAVSVAVSTFGGLDIAVNNAYNHEAALLPLALEEVTDANWHAQASVGWDGAYLLAQAVLPYLKHSVRGSFIMLGALAGLHGLPLNPVYSALKGGVRGFVKALAREWAPYNITVNAISPLAIADPTNFFSKHKLDSHTVARITRSFPMGRWGRPREDIGQAIVTICSTDFGFITAQNLQVDGGVYTAI